MKRTISTLILAALTAPVLSNAQSSGQVSRQQVKQEIKQLRAAGYAGDTDASYPEQLLTAEQRVATENTDAYGPPTSGTTMSGASGHIDAWTPGPNRRIQP